MSTNSDGKERRQTQPEIPFQFSKTGWGSLPATVRIKILDILTHQGHSGWTNYVCVSWEWYSIVSARTMHKIKLDSDSLDAFKKSIISRYYSMRVVQLHIKLPEYDCSGLRFKVTAVQIAKAGVKIYRDTCELLSVFQNRPLQYFVVIDLDGYSPEGIPENALRMQSGAHYVSHCHMDSPPPVKDIWRLSGEEDPRPREKPFRVSAVKSLIVRRQLCRWLYPELLKHILEHLPALGCIQYEPWRPMSRIQMYLGDIEMAKTISSLPSKLMTNIHVFEQVDSRLPKILSAAHLHGMPPHRGMVAQLATAFAKQSATLEMLSVAYIIDAELFFGSCAPNMS